MSSARLLCALTGLGLGFLFYLAHRSDHTLSNRLASSLCGTSYFPLKQELKQWLPMAPALRGCLPSALWCFIGTSLFGGWKIRLGMRRVLPLAWLCPCLNALWEVIQWIRWTDGRADPLDVVAGLVGWLGAHLILFRAEQPTEEIATLWNWRVGVVLTGCACMGLADVWR
ncbi:MAG: hypothetical protein V4773_04400 [Verrucomicrobiota bacterium]